MRPKFELTDSSEFGVVLKFFDVEMADQFDDFLTEKCYVHYSTKFDRDSREFYFGQAGSREKILTLIERFKNEQAT
jgi:hypothetical protein